jgi:hypothetical protein
VLFRFGRKHVSIFSLPRPTVRRPQCSRTGSTPGKFSDEGKSTGSKQCISNLSDELLAGSANHSVARKTEIATSHISASEAGRSLAGLRSQQPRKWIGWLHGEHCWRGRLVVLPGGEIAPLMWCRRGKLLLMIEDDLQFQSWVVWAAWREEEVQLFKHPAAVALGKMKRHVRERPSARKAQSARRNGRQPPRPGCKRGRPRILGLNRAAPKPQS